MLITMSIITDGNNNKRRLNYRGYKISQSTFEARVESVSIFFATTKTIREFAKNILDERKN